MAGASVNWSLTSVFVSGCPKNIPDADHLLAAYFSDENCSGGGPLQDVGFVEKDVIVCFEDPAAKARVLQKFDHRLQMPDGKEIRLTVMNCPKQLEEKYLPKPGDQLSEVSVGSESRSAFSMEALESVPPVQGGDSTHGYEGGQGQPQPSSDPLATEIKEYEAGASAELPVYRSTFCGDQGELMEKYRRRHNQPDVCSSVDEEKDDLLNKQSDERERTLLVDGYQGDVTPDILDLVFEGAAESAGIEDAVESVTVDETHAVVVCSTKEVAKMLVENPPEMNESVLRVSRPRTPSPPVPDPVASTPELQPRSRTIEVTGLKPVMNSAVLRLFFSKKKKCGGGPVEDVQVDSNTSTARITFCSPEDADEVVRRGQHSLGGTMLQVHHYPSSDETQGSPVQVDHNTTVEVLASHAGGPVPPSNSEYRGQVLSPSPPVALPLGKTPDLLDMKPEKPFPVPMGEPNVNLNAGPASQATSGSCPRDVTLEVHGIKPGTSKQLVELFFQSKRQAGGGDTRCLEYNEKTGDLLITYEEKEVAERVLAKQPLDFAGSSLRITQQPITAQPTVAPCTELAVVPGQIQVAGVVKYREDLVKAVFESKEMSGGGPIQDMVYDLSSGLVRISFQHPEDAENALKREKFIMGDQPWLLSPVTKLRKVELVPDPFTIEVRNIKPGISGQHISLFFESPRSKGGELVKMDYSEGKDVALLTFKDQAVASRLLEQKGLDLDGAALEISRHMMRVTDSSGVVPDAQTPSRSDTIEVKGIDPTVHEDFVKLFFESQKRSGGGPIKKMSFTDGVAIIKYERPEDAERVVDTNPRMEGGSLTINLLDTSPTEHSAVTTCAIEVKDIDPTFSRDQLELFFESERRSGGGTIVHLEHDTDSRNAVITFENPEVVKRVLAKGPLRLEKHEFHVSPVKPAPPPPIPRGVIDPGAVLVRHISPKCSLVDLRNFLEEHGHCKVEKITYGMQPGIAVIAFKGVPDYDNLRHISLLVPLRDVMVSVQKMEKPKCIQVHNIGNTKRETLEMYFENPRYSYGGPIKQVREHPNQGCMVIEFEERDVVDAVLQRSEHMVEQALLEVKAYHEGLGVIPPGYDTSIPSACIPSHIDLPITPAILQFWMNSTPNKQKIGDELQKLHCSAQWPAHSNAPIRLCCHLRQEMPAIQALAKRWEADVQGAIYNITHRYESVQIQPLQQAWKPFIRKVNLTPTDKDLLDIHVNANQCEILLVGKQREVMQKSEELHQKLREVIDEMNRKAKSVEETISSLSSPQLNLLLAHKIPERIKQDYPHVNYDIRKGKIHIKGLPEDIMNVKLHTFEFVQNPPVDFIKMSPSLKQFLARKEVENFLLEELGKGRVTLVWDAVEDGVKLYASSKDELARGKAILQSGLVEKTMTVSKQSTSVMKGAAWKKFANGINSNPLGVAQVHLESHERKTTIIVTATASVFEEVEKMVQGFLEENTILDDFVPLSHGVARFAEKHLQSEIHAISADLKVSLKVECAKDPHGVLLQGTSTAMESAKSKVEILAAGVLEKMHRITKTGMKNVFDGLKGKQFCEYVESRMKATVEVLPEYRQEHPQDSSPANAVQMKSMVTLDGGAVVKVVMADLPTYHADAIVNAANTDMLHSGGLAGAIVKAGGRDIQDECTGYVRQHGKVLPGNVYVSGAGSLPAKKIIHAVGPMWKGGHASEHNTLFEATFESLKVAGKFRLQTIAIPAISTGIFGYPLQGATEVLVSAIIDYYSEGNILPAEVHLVDNSDRTVNTFHKTLVMMCGEDNVQTLEGQTATLNRGQRPPRNPPKHKKRGKPKADKPPVDPLKPALFSAVGKHQVRAVAGGLKVTMTTGSIDQQQVNVIVNTTSKDFNLNTGAVSAAILKAGGPSLQTEILASAPNGVQPGEIVVTSGGNLQCHNVYHGALESWDGPGGRAPTILRSFLQNCLSQAHNDSKVSVALPPLGTGNLHCPPDDVARIMLEETARFSEQNPNTTLKDVFIVIYQKDQGKIPIFEKAMQDATTAQLTGSREAGNRHGCYRGAGTAARSPGGDSSMATWDVIGAGEAFEYGEQHVNVGPLLLVVRQGDLTKETTDVIVNSSNERLDLSGGAVQMAIVRAGGPSIAKECKDLGGTKGGIAVTSAGNLQAKRIIHIAPQRDHDPSSWQKVVKKTLSEADKLGMASVAFPALGTGIVGSSADKMANAMFEGLAQFVEKEKPGTLSRVHFTVFQPRMMKLFIDTLKAKVEEKNRPSIWKRIFGGAASATYSMGPESRPESESQPDLVVEIFAQSQSVIDNAIQEITQFCETETKDEVIDSPEEQALIQKLSQEQITQVESLQRIYAVRITVEQKKRTNRIRIQGASDDTMQARAAVMKVLHEVHSIEQEREAAALIANQVQWEYQDHDQSFCPYPPEQNMRIEKAHHEKKPSVQWSEEGNTFMITFSSMKESIVGQANSEVTVRRSALAEAQLPQNWQPMAADSRFKLVDLLPSDAEYKKVEANLGQSIGTAQIVKIQRVQNPSLYMPYQAQKTRMDKANAGAQNERMLWHGTAPDVLNNINGGGLNRTYCGKNAVMYGMGVYFAVSADYSARSTYSPPDPQTGHKYMYHCRVLTGLFTTGHQGCREPPEKDPQKPGDRYDSVADSTTNPGIFVIFNDTQTYPEHLITFK